MLRGPLAFHTVAQALVDEIMVRLEAEAVTGAAAPDRACVVPGAVAWDECDCGLLAVSLGRVYPSASFPTEAFGNDLASGGPCGPPLIAADLTVQLVRCTPGPTASGAPLSCAALDESARAVITDAWHARLGAHCALKALEDAREIIDWRVGALTSLGPDGGCAGSQLTATAAIPAPCC